MSKINILFVMLQMEMGGAERLVYNLAQKLDRSLFNPSVAWFFGDNIHKDFADLNIPLFKLCKNKRFDVSTMQQLANVIRNNNIHIVNAHHFMSLVYVFYGCKIKNNTSLIYTEHSEWELERLPLKWRIIGNYLLKRAEGSIGVSRAVSEQITKKLKTESSRTHCILNGVDFKAFEIGKKDVRKKLGITHTEKVIGTIANFRKIKNHILLLKAFNELKKQYKDVKLLLIGQGFKCDSENSEWEIREFIKKKSLDGCVTLLGFRSDIPDLLSIMDIFCLTSFKEGLPLSLIEAMAAGLPVVGTDVEGIRDVIIHESNGYLVPISDVNRLAEVLLNLLHHDSLRDKLGRESSFLAKEIYSLEHCIKKYTDFYLSSLKNHAVAGKPLSAGVR